jgi:protein-tyrosine phosphatase
VELARALHAAGTRTVAATPHVRDDHPFPLRVIGPRVRQLNRLFAHRGIEIEVVAGAEVALSKLTELDDETLGDLCLGRGPHLLVESPYTYAPELLEKVIFDLQARGVRPVLAHPERSPSFFEEPGRLARLVENGVLCSVTAGSMAGTFGGSVRRFSLELFKEELVHDVASDAHGPTGRPLDLRYGFERLDVELPGIAERADWFTVDAPAAILAGEDLPRRPGPPQGLRKGWRRLLGGRHPTGRVDSAAPSIAAKGHTSGFGSALKSARSVTLGPSNAGTG